jgi:hypothetical protein
MLSNFETCPHCVAKGKSGSIWRMHERTPLISRSDGTTFHLTLFDGPGPLYVASGRTMSGRAAALFLYDSEALGLAGKVLVIIRTANLRGAETIPAIESAADKIAEALESGHRPEQCYFYDEQLSPFIEDRRLRLKLSRA